MNNNVAMFIGITLIVIAIIIFVIVLYHKMKKIRVSAIYFISGAVKTGKSAMMVWLGIREYIKKLINFYIRSLLIKELVYFTLHRSNRINYAYSSMRKPILITNMPLRYIRWYPFTSDILLRKCRIPNQSVLLLDETSLIADSQLIKNMDINKKLLTFYKLWGHYSHGGTLICNSQAWSDNHYSLKRCMSRYLYIYNSTKLPLVSWFKVKELAYSEDNSMVNMNTNDMENNGLVHTFIPNIIFKLYDKFYLSAFTDDLVFYDGDAKQLKMFDSLKVNKLVTLQDFNLTTINETNNDTKKSNIRRYNYEKK